MKKLDDLIAKFLSNKVKIAPRNERADADPKDVKDLQEIIRLLCEKKWEASYDGFIPVQVDLVNRSTHEAFHYEPQPYIQDNDEAQEYQTNFEEKMRIATMNLNLATKEVDMIWRNQEASLRVSRALKAGKYCRQHGEFQTSGKCPNCKK